MTLLSLTLILSLILVTDMGIGKSRYPSKQLEMSVHHADYRPENNEPENLMALCSACHLYYHRNGQGNILDGQLLIHGLEQSL